MSETWVINESPDYTSFPNTVINGYMQNSGYSFTQLLLADGYDIDINNTAIPAGEKAIDVVSEFGNIFIYGYFRISGESIASVQWYEYPEWKTIVFETAPTGDLLTWLQANAVKQSSQVSVDLTTLSGYESLGTGTHDITVVAKADGYLDSDPSEAVQFTKGGGGAVDFATDSWATIASAIKSGTDPYNLGDTRTENITVEGTTYSVTYKIIDNKVGRYSTQSGSSHKVIEIQSGIGQGSAGTTGYAWNSSGSASSFASSDLFSSLNNTIVTQLSSELQAVLETTTCYSSDGTQAASSTTVVAATGKLFSPSMNELYGDSESYGYSNAYETQNGSTNYGQFSYYKEQGVTTSNYTLLIKNNLAGTATYYWTRSPSSSNFALYVYSSGGRYYYGYNFTRRACVCFAW